MSGSPRVKIGLIGCGAIAEGFHLPALRRDPRTKESIVLSDLNEDRRESIATAFDVRKTVGDFRELKGLVDGVIVATPPSSHYAIAKWCLEEGIPVLCEKPLCESLSEAQELVKAAAANSTPLAVNQTRRFFPTYQLIRKLIQDGVLGSLEKVTYHDGVEFDWPAASPHHFTKGAKGALSDTGIHLLDSILFWIDGRLDVSEAYHDGVEGPEAMATVRMRGACDAEIKVSRLGRLKNGFTIRGSLGTIEAQAEDFDAVTVQFRDGKSKTYRAGKKGAKYTDFADPLISNFVDAIEGKAAPYVQGSDVLESIRLLEDAYRESKAYQEPWNIPWGQTEQASVPPKRVLITGASGFLGARILELMHLLGGYAATGTIRQWSRASRPSRIPANLVTCDITDPREMEQLLSQGFDAVIHTAYNDSHEGIVDATSHLLKAAKAHGVERFVYLSSAEAYGSSAEGTVLESRETPLTGNAYGDWKIQAEERCIEHRSDQFSATILRPSIIHGPFGNSWSIDIAKRLMSGKWGRFEENGEGIVNLVYVDDLVRAILLCLEHPNAKNQLFNVNGPDRLTWNQYFELMNRHLALPELREISKGSSGWKTFAMDKFSAAADLVLDRFEDQLMEIYLRGGILSRIMKRIKGELDATPTGTELNDLFSRSAHFDAGKIEEMLGFRPAFDAETGVALTVHWLRLHEITEQETLPELQPQMLRGMVPSFMGACESV